MDEALLYWQRYEAAWERPLRMLDVQAAWGSGELDGILPSGRPSRASTERLLTLPRALELFESGELQVRRRFRNMKLEELRSRWEPVVSRRAKLQAEQRWEAILVESDQMRKSQKARIDATPRTDGGFSAALAGLLATAGASPEERWLTAALLADIEAEMAALPETRSASPARSGFAAREAARDVEEASAFGWYGVVAGLVVGAVVNYVVVSGQQSGAGGGTDAAGLERALDLLQ